MIGICICFPLFYLSMASFSMVHFQKSVSSLSDQISELRSIVRLFRSAVSHKYSSVLSDTDSVQVDRRINHLEQLFQKTVTDARNRLTALKQFNGESERKCSLDGDATAKKDLNQHKKSVKTDSNSSYQNNHQNFGRNFDSKTESKNTASGIQKNNTIKLDNASALACKQHCAGLTAALRSVCTEFRQAQVIRRQHESQAQEHPQARRDHKSDTAKVAHIAKAISELCTLIDELHTTVEASGKTLDRIETKTAASQEATRAGTNSLRRALRYRISAMRWKRAIAIAFAVAFLILLTFFGIKIYTNLPKSS